MNLRFLRNELVLKSILILNMIICNCRLDLFVLCNTRCNCIETFMCCSTHAISEFVFFGDRRRDRVHDRSQKSFASIFDVFQQFSVFSADIGMERELFRTLWLLSLLFVVRESVCVCTYLFSERHDVSVFGYRRRSLENRD